MGRLYMGGGKGGHGKIGGSRWNAESNFRRMSFRKFFASARKEKIWTVLATECEQEENDAALILLHRVP